MLDHLATFGVDGIPGVDAVRFVSINWGPWGEAGMAKAGTKAHEVAVKDGDRPLKTRDALTGLAMVMQAIQEEPLTASQFAICDVDWERSFLWKESPLLERLVRRSTPSDGLSSGGSVTGKVEETIGPVAVFFSEHVGSPWSKLEMATMAASGLDSLDVVTLRNSFTKKFKTVPLSVFTKPNVTFGQLEAVLAQHA